MSDEKPSLSGVGGEVLWARIEAISSETDLTPEENDGYVSDRDPIGPGDLHHVDIEEELPAAPVPPISTRSGIGIAGGSHSQSFVPRTPDSQLGVYAW